MEYIDPLRDEKGGLCTNSPQHKKRLLDGVLGSIQGTINRLWPLELTEAEFRFADEKFYMPLKQSLAAVATGNGWSIPSPIMAHEKSKRGFCASPSWYHTFSESKARQGLAPSTIAESSGTLHPNGFGHFYSSLRVLAHLRAKGDLAGHNLHLMTAEEFDPKVANVTLADKTYGFAFYLMNKHNPLERLSRYYKF
jgi:hypothetical protein